MVSPLRRMLAVTLVSVATVTGVAYANGQPMSTIVGLGVSVLVGAGIVMACYYFSHRGRVT